MEILCLYLDEFFPVWLTQLLDILQEFHQLQDLVLDVIILRVLRALLNLDSQSLRQSERVHLASLIFFFKFSKPFYGFSDLIQASCSAKFPVHPICSAVISQTGPFVFIPPPTTPIPAGVALWKYGQASSICNKWYFQAHWKNWNYFSSVR